MSECGCFQTSGGMGMTAQRTSLDNIPFGKCVTQVYISDGKFFSNAQSVVGAGDSVCEGILNNSVELLFMWRKKLQFFIRNEKNIGT